MEEVNDPIWLKEMRARTKAKREARIKQFYKDNPHLLERKKRIERRQQRTKNIKLSIFRTLSKTWNNTVNRWETGFILLSIIKLSKYTIMKPYPERQYILDKTYSISWTNRTK
jgi:hypothetical protein